MTTTGAAAPPDVSRSGAADDDDDDDDDADPADEVTRRGAGACPLASRLSIFTAADPNAARKAPSPSCCRRALAAVKASTAGP